MNGTFPIYRLEPLFQLPLQLDLPACMFRLNNPVACVKKAENFENEKKILNGIMDQVKGLVKKPLPELAQLEARWDSVLLQLADLKLQMATIRKTVTSSCESIGFPQVENTTLSNFKVFHGAVINANPTNPPYSLLLLKDLYKYSVQIDFSIHIHSSIYKLPDAAECFINQLSTNNDSQVKILIIWKEGITDTELVINPIKQLPIRGEVNILRFFAKSGLKFLHYPCEEIIDTIQADSLLDICHRLLHIRGSKERASLLKNLNAKLGRSSYFGGENINITDIAIWSSLKQLNVNITQDLSQSMAKWFERINRMVFE